MEVEAITVGAEKFREMFKDAPVELLDHIRMISEVGLEEIANFQAEVTVQISCSWPHKAESREAQLHRVMIAERVEKMVEANGNEAIHKAVNIMMTQMADSMSNTIDTVDELKEARGVNT